MKKITFWLFTLMLSILLIEGSSFIILSAKARMVLFHKDYALIDQDTFKFAQWAQPENIHPYIGYVSTYVCPNKKSTNPKETSDHPSEYGFRDTQNPIQQKSPDKLIIGIFGGSVAERFFLQGGIKVLKEELRKNKYFSDKQFVFLNFSNGGYKQPQQLMILNYILALGGNFDIVINLDGFNEVALSASENIPNKVFPFFPRLWHMRVGPQSISQKELRVIGTISNLQDIRDRLYRSLSSAPLSYSNTSYLLWEYLNRYLLTCIAKERLLLSSLRRSTEQDYVVTGPSRQYNSPQEMYGDLAAVWANCSLQMSKICQANNIVYFHFLQPNQYVANSKIINQDEQKIAIADYDHMPYRKPVEEGYSFFRAAGKDLHAKQVNFFDLVNVFSNNCDIIYSDNCCHVNKEGNQILAHVIGKTVLEIYETNNQ